MAGTEAAPWRINSARFCLNFAACSLVIGPPALLIARSSATNWRERDIGSELAGGALSELATSGGAGWLTTDGATIGASGGGSTRTGRVLSSGAAVVVAGFAGSSDRFCDLKAMTTAMSTTAPTTATRTSLRTGSAPGLGWCEPVELAGSFMAGGYIWLKD